MSWGHPGIADWYKMLWGHSGGTLKCLKKSWGHLGVALDAPGTLRSG